MNFEKPSRLFRQTSPADIATCLRAIRKGRGLSLAQVEKLSHGAIKAVVLGSYERSDRSLSVTRAIEIADLYGVPLTHLLGSSPEQLLPDSQRNRIVIDLRRASRLSSLEVEAKEKIRIFTTFIAWIASQRSDWNGEVLSLRRNDLSTLALLTFTSESAVIDWLVQEKLILKEPVHS